MTIVAMLAVISTWIGLRALLGLYPGYGLDPVEQLRRHTYATFTTLAILLGLLVLSPFVQHLVKLRMKRTDLWGQPVVVLGHSGAGANVVSLLREEWELGYDPVAVFDYRLETVGAVMEGVDDRNVLAAVVDLAREHDAHTAVFATYAANT
jgi:FlaA1/EpsC-like NDP-sugar epimerase